MLIDVRRFFLFIFSGGGGESEDVQVEEPQVTKACTSYENVAPVPGFLFMEVNEMNPVGVRDWRWIDELSL